MNKEFKLFEELLAKQIRLSRSEDLQFLKELDVEDLAQRAIYFIKDGIEKQLPVSTICCAIGVSVDSKAGDVEQFKIGYLLSYPLVKSDKLSFDNQYQRQAKNERAKLFTQYKQLKSNQSFKKKDMAKVIRVLDSEFISNLFLNVPLIENIKPEASVQIDMPEDWTGYHHPKFGKFINHCNPAVKSMLNPQYCPKVFDVVNKLQKVELAINDEVLWTVIHHEKALYKIQEDDANKIYTLNGDELTKESLSGKKTEISRTIEEALKVQDTPFYIVVKPEFRGRLNYCSSYLNPSGSDLAKGIIKSAVGKRLGQRGWNALLTSAANHWGGGASVASDKLPREAKIDLMEDMLDDIVECGSNPRKHTLWMKADKPVQFLAHAIDIAKAVNSGNEWDYVSDIFCGQDASTSGPMIMGLSTQDYNTMLLTNNIVGKDRNDIYLAVGKRVREKLLKMQDELGSLNDLEGSDSLELFEQALFLKRNEEAVIESSVGLFLELFGEDKILRKWVKRPVMIVGYSAEEWCIAEALWDDFHAGCPWLTPPACKFLADLIYASYGEILPACMQVMEGLKKFSTWVHDSEEHFFINSVWDNFPFMQNYLKMETVDVKVSDKNKDNGKSWYSIQFQTDKLDYHASKSGLAPNKIHNGDSVLLRRVVYYFEGPMVVNHDGFYCLAADFDEMGYLLRETTDLMADQYNILNNLINQYSDLVVEEKIREERVAKSGANEGKKYFVYKKTGNLIEPTLENLGIKMNDRHKDFAPKLCEFNYA